MYRPVSHDRVEVDDNLVFFVSEGTAIDIRAKVVVLAKSAAFAAAVDAGQHG